MYDAQMVRQFGKALLKEGIITERQLQHALQVQLDSFEKKRLGQILIDLGYVTARELRDISQKYHLRQPLGEILVYNKFITKTDLETALEEQKSSGKRLGEHLLDTNKITEDQLARAISLQLDIPYIVPNKRLIDKKLFQRFPNSLMKQWSLLPLFKNDNVITVLVHDPFNQEMVRMLTSVINEKIEFAVGPEPMITRVLKEMMEESSVITDRSPTPFEETAASSQFHRYDLDKAIANQSSSTQAMSIVDFILSNAISQKASDIHIDSMYSKLRVRHRVDGHLIFDTDLPKNVADQVVRRIKVMSQIGITDAVDQQDGNMYVKYMDKNIDLRVSIYPTVLGPSITIRSLTKEIGLKSLEELGMLPRVLWTLKQILDTPGGLILFTGPAGSGKTTSLYACLNYLNQDSLKICTVETPVEYSIEGVAQCQLRNVEKDKIGERVKSMLHQDADVIVLGEITDEDSAKAAVTAALTGHKVFSTIHTDDTFAAILRLMDLGMRNYLLSSTGIATVAQRLLRKICPKCKEPFTPDRELFKNYNLKDFDPDNWEFYHGRGCAHCNQTGFSGRTGLFEILVFNDEIRNAFLKNQSSSILRKLTQNTKLYLSLREAGFIKALQGETTLEEALSILSYSEKQSFASMELTEKDIRYWMGMDDEATHPVS